MQKAFPVKVVFEAVDKITGAVRGISAKIKAMTKPLADSSGLGGLSKMLMPTNDGSFRAIAAEASAAFGTIARTALGAAAGVGALFAVVKSYVNAADDIGDTAEKIGVSTNALQELRYAAELSDVSAEELDQGLKFLNKNMVEAARGSGDAAKWFSVFGLKATHANGRMKTADEMLVELSGHFQTLESGALKTSAAMALFGRSGDKIPLFLSKGPAEIARLREEAHAMGVVLSKEAIESASEFDHQLKRLGKVALGVRNQFATGMLPAFQEFSVELMKFLADNRQVFVEFGAALGDALKQVLPMVLSFMRSLVAAMQWFTALPVEEKAAVLSLAMKALAVFALAPAALAVLKLVLSFGQLLQLVAGPVIWAFKNWSLIVSVAGGAFNTLMGVFAVLKPILMSVMGLFTLKIAIILAVVAAIAALIYYWDDVVAFFSDMGAMLKDFAADFLSGFLSPISGAIDKLKELLGMTSGGVSGEIGVNRTMAPALGAEDALAQTLAAQSSRNEVAVKVDFANAPKGTTFATEKNTGADLDLGMGFAMVN